MSFDLLLLLLLFAAGIPSSLFCVYYAIVAPWWRSPEGVNLFGFTLAIAFTFDFSIALHLVGHIPGIRIIAVILYAAIAAFLWQRLWLLARAARRP